MVEELLLHCKSLIYKKRLMCVFDDTNRSAVYYAITGSKVKQLEKLIRAGCDLRFF